MGERAAYSPGSKPSGSKQFSSDPSTARLGALLWLLCFQYFVAEQIVRLHIHGPYSMARNMISDLGAVHSFGVGAAPATSNSPLHWLMNASFTLQGLLIFLGAVLVRRLFSSGVLTSAAFSLFAISGAGVFVVGLAPEDVSGHVHLLAATIHFVCGGLAMLLLGLTLVRKSPAAGTFSLTAATLALGATMLLGFRNAAAWTALGWGVGAVERIAAYPLPLWLTLTGLLLLTRRHSASAIH